MRKIFLFLLMLASFICQGQETAANNARTNRKEAKKWFRKKQWLQGVKLKPSKTINELEFFRQYGLNKKYWDEAIAFVKEHDLNSLPPGRYEIDGPNVFASVTESPTRDLSQTGFESHQRYIDFQYIIDGEELIGVNSINALTITKPYEDKNDSANYSGAGTLYKATPTTFFIFFPSDAHRPGISAGGNSVVKKLVIKVRAA
jgi:YhcH/YjgK/YiaL family protein